MSPPSDKLPRSPQDLWDESTETVRTWILAASNVVGVWYHAKSWWEDLPTWIRRAIVLHYEHP